MIYKLIINHESPAHECVAGPVAYRTPNTETYSYLAIHLWHPPWACPSLYQPAPPSIILPLPLSACRSLYQPAAPQPSCHAHHQSTAVSISLPLYQPTNGEANSARK